MLLFPEALCFAVVNEKPRGELVFTSRTHGDALPNGDLDVCGCRLVCHGEGVFGIIVTRGCDVEEKAIAIDSQVWVVGEQRPRSERTGLEIAVCDDDSGVCAGWRSCGCWCVGLR